MTTEQWLESLKPFPDQHAIAVKCIEERKKKDQEKEADNQKWEEVRSFLTKYLKPRKEIDDEDFERRFWNV